MDGRFPVGRFARVEAPSNEERAGWIAEIRGLPAALSGALESIPERDLETPYREGGWTARQVVHHLADSHMNAYVRLRLALTEEEPVVKTYDEKRWAELPDARVGSIEASLAILHGLHERMASLFASLPPADFERVLIHPDQGRMRVVDLLQLYAWHGRHHVAHVQGIGSR